MINISFIVYGIIFTSLLIGGGYFAKKWVSTSDDFIVAGREISFPINTLAVVAIGFAGTSIALAPGFSILYGAKGGIIWGIVYSIFGLMLYANIFAKFIRRSGALTLPEYFETRYNGKIRGLVAITTVIGMCGILANNVAVISSIIAGYTGWSILIIRAAAFLIILAFATMSGLWATSITDFIQVSIGTIAVPVFLIILMNKFGVSGYFSSWLSGDWVNAGLAGHSLPGFTFEYPSILTFMILFGTALVWGNNYYWIKISSCRNESVARKSYTVGSLYLIFIFMIPLSLIGIFAGARMPEMFTLAGGSLDHTAAYGTIARVITPWLGSLFIVGAAAAGLSTSSTAALGATSTATRDIYQRMIKEKSSPKSALTASRVIMALVVIFTWVLTFFPGGPTYLFAFANAWLTPPAVLLLLGAFWPRFNSRGAFWGVLSGMTVMVILTFTQLSGIFDVGQWTHIAIVGFFVSLIVGVIVALTAPPKYFGESDWSVEAKESNREDLNLNDLDLKVLSMIRTGHHYLADITDGLELDSNTSSTSIEKLDRGGYIEREGLRGSKFYTFNITKKANEVLPELSDKEKEMNNNYLNPKYVKFLKMLSINPDRLDEFIEENSMNSLSVTSMVSHLARNGYLKEKGLFKRKVEITEEGKQMVKKYA